MLNIMRLANYTTMRVGSALVGLIVPALWIALLLSRPDEAVRIRTALIADLGEVSDFAWDPATTPRTYLRNSGPVPKLFIDAARSALTGLPEPHGTLDAATSFARLLMSAGHRIEDPIRSDITTSYHGIVGDGRGYCADFVQVFNGLGIAGAIPVRDWGFAFDAFGSGHAFNEVFDETRHKWVMVDSFHSLLFVDPGTREPLSVMEVHDRLLRLDRQHNEPEIQRIVAARFPFRSDALALEYYRRGMPQLFLVWGNNVFDYESAVPVRAMRHVSRSAEQLVGILFGLRPRVRIYPLGLSERDLIELRSHGREFLLALALQLLALFFCGLQAYAALRARTTGK